MEYIDLTTHINIGASSYDRAKAQADVSAKCRVNVCERCGSLKRGEGCTQCVPHKIGDSVFGKVGKDSWMR